MIRNKVKGYFLKWKNLTQDILNELATARERLSREGRPWPKITGTNVPVNTWETYCQDIGLEKRTVNPWLERHQKPQLPCRTQLGTPPYVNDNHLGFEYIFLL